MVPSLEQDSRGRERWTSSESRGSVTDCQTRTLTVDAKSVLLRLPERLGTVTPVEEEMTSGPARNRTANPLIKSSLGDTTTAGHDLPPPGILDDYEP